MGEVWVLLMVLNSPGNPIGSPAALTAEFTTQNKCITAASDLMSASGSVILSSGIAIFDSVPVKKRFDVVYVCARK